MRDSRQQLRRHVLYVEHRAADIEQTVTHFAEVAAHLRVEVVRTCSDAVQRLQEEEPDLVLVDVRMPDMNGLEFLREARHRGVDVPIIVISDEGDEAAAVAAMKLGAYDYVVKRQDYLIQLPYAIDNAVDRFQLRQTNRRLEKELAERKRVEAHVRRLNVELENRVADRTRELQVAQNEREESRVLELIAQNAPLGDILGNLASLASRRAHAVVSVEIFPNRERVGGGFAGAGGSDAAANADPLISSDWAVARPDGSVESAAAIGPAGIFRCDSLTAVIDLPERTTFPIHSLATSVDIGQFVVYQHDGEPLAEAARQVIERCTRLCSIAVNRIYAESRIRRQALEDPLTGLANRALLSDRVTQALAAAQRDRLSVGVLLFDLDRFKSINDGFGHDVGDHVLRHVAAQLQASVRPSDTVGRLGGDEFAVVLPRLSDIDEAERITKRALEAIAQPMQLDGVVLITRASVGIAVHPAHGENAARLLRSADAAMYRAKRLGGMACVYDPFRDSVQLEHSNMLAELQHAIEADQLILYYQPKINLRTGRTDGVECLVRWNHPQRGFLNPIEFIPLAETTGLIRPLSLWTIRRALEDCRSWRERGFDMTVAVNLSPHLLYDPDLFAAIDRLIYDSNVGQNRLEVEITEGSLMMNPERAKTTIHRLRTIGVAFALDDFGTGYSSLAYLKNLQVQSIKIDQSFVRDMAHDQRIVRAVIDLGHSFSLDIVAEGVENEDVHQLLRSSGCDHAQGFHLAKPMINSEFLEYAEQDARRPH
jgi:diguanylate cyclase (GGDEF)-like protein